MAVNRRKRTTAGKAPQRLDQTAGRPSRPPIKLKLSNRASQAGPGASQAGPDASQNSTRSQKAVPEEPVKESICPVFLSRAEDIFTASPSFIKKMLSDSEDELPADTDTQL